MKGRDMTQGRDVELLKDGDTYFEEVAIDDMRERLGAYVRSAHLYSRGQYCH